MKKTILKIGCLLFAIVMILSTFVSCNLFSETEETEQGAGVTTNMDDVPPIEHKDWGGETFDILSVQNEYESNFELVGELNGNRMEPAVFQRNLWIKENYNVELVQHGSVSDDALDTLAAQIDAGDNDYDLVFLFRDDMSSAIMRGYMTDLTKVKYLDFSNEWYNQNTINSMKINGRLFHMVSDFSLVDKSRTNVLFFNRDIAKEDSSLPDVMGLVRSGEWTIEEMLICMNAYANDANGDTMMTLEDKWGLVCGGKEASYTIWKALGNDIVSINADGAFSVNLTTDHSVNSIEEVRKLFKSNLSFTGNKFGNYSDPSNTFVAKKAMFFSGCLGSIENISREADFSFTALPFPKYDTEQTQYYTTNDNTYCATFGIPVCAKSTEFSGYMVEILSWKSHSTTFPEYYNILCKVKNSYDTECAEMLDLVFEGLVFDFGLLNSKSITSVRSSLEKSIMNGKDIASEYESKKSIVETNIKNLFLQIESFDKE